jgi:VWFA-related protein
MRRTGPVLLLALTALFVSLSGQQPPTFRSSVDLVTVDATVTGDDGTPVTDLRAEDFEIKVDGQPRAVASAQFVSYTPSQASLQHLAAAHYSSNEHVNNGRLILFVVDQDSLRRAGGQEALRAAAGFIDMLHPIDRLAVTALPWSGPFVEFTTNHRRVRQVMEGLVGQATPPPVYFQIGLMEALEISEGSRAYLNDAVRRECGTTLTESESPARMSDPVAGRDPCPVQLEQEARALAQYVRNQTRTSLAGLRSLLEQLKTVEGPKTIVLLSEGLIAEPRFVDMSDLAVAAHAARATIHVLQPEAPLLDALERQPSPTALRDRQLREDGLARVAGAGRGGLFHLVGNSPIPFQRIARELTGYYLLAFHADERDRDGRVHAIDVKLRRTRATLRARQAFTVPKLEPPTASLAARLAGLLRAPMLETELPLRVSTYTYQEPGQAKVRIVVSAETDPATDEASTPVLAFVLRDEREVIAATATHDAPGGAYAFSALVAPGDYTLKVAGIDPLGRRGSVERPFGARLTEAGTVRMSDLMIADVPERPEASLRPAVTRPVNDQALAYLELYADDGVTLKTTRVRIDVSDSEVGPTFLTIPATVHTRDARWAIARAVLPLDGLPPGRYFARANVTVAGAEARRIARPFTVGAGAHARR